VSDPLTLPSSQSRAEGVTRLLRPYRDFLFDTMATSSLGKREASRVLEYMLQEADIVAALHQSKTPEAGRAVEHDRARPLVARLRQFSLRHNLTLAAPFWSAPQVDEDPNLMFFAGGDDVRGAVTPVARERGIAIADIGSGWGIGQTRWTDLRRSAVGLFDLTGTDAAQRARVCYGIGNAIALGKFVAVVMRSDAPPLFDLDLEPWTWKSPSDAHAIGERLDHALYGMPPRQRTSSVAETVGRVLRSLPSDDPSRALLEPLTRMATVDPVEAALLLNPIVTQSGESHSLLTPLWPPTYPAEHQRHCFHVTPFAATFDDGCDAVRRACTRAGVIYRRGDETGRPEVIRSIWNEIGAANLVVVDVTGLNPNVSVELGLAHALGRPVLLVSQREQESRDKPSVFPEIERLQIAAYSTPQHLGELVLSRLSTKLIE
jgi:nucleoside 2-deoxyribosyltransferase